MSEKVLIAMPNAGQVHTAAICAAHAAAQELGTQVMPVVGRPAEHCRNRLAQLFLQGDWDRLLTIDSDVEILAGGASKLLAVDADIVTAAVPIVMDNHLTTGLIGHDPEGRFFYSEGPGEPFEIEECGAGCLLIKRRVFEQIPFPWFDWVEDPVSATGEDIYFCRKARQFGFHIVAHGGVLCGHYKTVDLAFVRRLILACAGKIANEREGRSLAL